ncbi:hypothetical protein [uncultured Pseudomonas sp.]|uniref:hypothetical protein n=1 Tax=uncultured Pseudomonas sp. TaxID=114707 RepID=UPI0025F0955D|nr:hypothetical protein [uncultured Pseudomonas sp.]
MSRRKPYNHQARIARACRSLLAVHQVAVLDIEHSTNPDQMNQRLISLRSALPIARDQLPTIVDAFCDFPYRWTVYFAALCQAPQGGRYIKAEEIALQGVYLAGQLSDVIKAYSHEIRDRCNTLHLVATAWIANPSNITLDEAQADHILEAFDAWTNPGPPQGLGAHQLDAIHEVKESA